MYEYVLTYITKIIGQYLLLNCSFYFLVWWDVCLHVYECLHTYKYIHESRRLDFSDAARKQKAKEIRAETSRDAAVQSVSPRRQKPQMKVFGKCWAPRIHMKSLAEMKGCSLYTEISGKRRFLEGIQIGFLLWLMQLIWSWCTWLKHQRYRTLLGFRALFPEGESGKEAVIFIFGLALFLFLVWNLSWVLQSFFGFIILILNIF